MSRYVIKVLIPESCDCSACSGSFTFKTVGYADDMSELAAEVNAARSDYPGADVRCFELMQREIRI